MIGSLQEDPDRIRDLQTKRAQLWLRSEDWALRERAEICLKWLNSPDWAPNVPLNREGKGATDSAKDYLESTNELQGRCGASYHGHTPLKGLVLPGGGGLSFCSRCGAACRPEEQS